MAHHRRKMRARLNANQRDALISFTFPCGAGYLRALCRGRFLAQICEAMIKRAVAVK